MKDENRLKDPLLVELLHESEEHTVDLSRKVMTQIFAEKLSADESKSQVVFQNEGSTIWYVLLGFLASMFIIGGLFIAGSFFVDFDFKNISKYSYLLDDLFLYVCLIACIGIVFFMYDKLGEFFELKRLGLFRDGSMKTGHK